MQKLIKTVNKLQDTFSAIGVQTPIDLPQIVVIGSQSSGKSSILESLVGKDFLPRGPGIVTRRPLILQLIHTGSGDEKEKEKEKEKESENSEWGEFLHYPGRKFFDFDEIRDEIVADTDAKTGGRNSKNVSPVPINLRIYSPNVPTLTLVDLPGITKIPIHGQPADIEKQIYDMACSYVSKENSLILSVTAANTDIGNSDGLKLAKEVDPTGSRTIGVLSKIDLMDKGTNAVDILAGRVVPLRLGYVPVVNRSQKDIDTKKKISDALEDERKFFESNAAYKDKAEYCGIPYLGKKLSIILVHHIRTTLPQIKSTVVGTCQKYTNELASLGEKVDDSDQGLILSIISDVCNDFGSMIDGHSPNVSTTELNGGARICFVFHEIFSNVISKISPFDQITDQEIRIILYNSSGLSPSLFPTSTGFRYLMTTQIKRLCEPSLKCVSLIYDELVRILDQLLQKPFFHRFPLFKERLHSVVIDLYEKHLNQTNTFVSSIINSECCYINTTHPDFVGGHKALATMSEKLIEKDQQSSISKHSAAAYNNRGSYGDDEDDDRYYDRRPKERPSSYDRNTKVVPNIPDKIKPFSSFSPSEKGKSRILERPPSVLKAVGSLSDRESIEVQITKTLLESYYNIVKKTVVDLVPKITINHLIGGIKENLQKTLISTFYKCELGSDLLKESEDVSLRRRECKKMIKALKEAEKIISSV